MKNILVLYGGASPEHEVSIASARSIVKHLNPAKYNIWLIKISKENKWFLQSQFDQDDTTSRKIEPLTWMQENKIDICFPILHGQNGEDGTIQGLLELTNIPYVGCKVASSSMCMDKVIQKQVCSTANIPQVPYIWFLARSWNENSSKIIQDISTSLNFPLFIKPARAGSSVGISKLPSLEEIPNAVMQALKFDTKIIVEQAVQKAREIEISILGNQEPQASVLGEIISSNEFYDYDAKYIDGKSQEIIPAEVRPKVAKQIKQIALSTYRLMDCSGLSRIDFLINSQTNQVFLNEVNTMPGFTEFSMYPKLWQASGINYPDLIDKLISLAVESHRFKEISPNYLPSNPSWYKQLKN